METNYLFTVKTCTAPVIPANTYVVESKELYNCAETIEVRCADCYELGGKNAVCLFLPYLVGICPLLTLKNRHITTDKPLQTAP